MMTCRADQLLTLPCNNWLFGIMSGGSSSSSSSWAVCIVVSTGGMIVEITVDCSWSINRIDCDGLRAESQVQRQSQSSGVPCAWPTHLIHFWTDTHTHTNTPHPGLTHTADIQSHWATTQIQVQQINSGFDEDVLFTASLGNKVQTLKQCYW